MDKNNSSDKKTNEENENEHTSKECYSNICKKEKEDGKRSETKKGDPINEQEVNEISDKYIKYLECIKNNWSSSQASKLLNKKLIKYISERFLYMSSSLKVRVLTSFFYLTDKLRMESERHLLLITANGEIDGNGWVKKFSRILKPFFKTGVIDIKDIDSQTMHRILNYIDQENSCKNGKNCYMHNKKELEYIHMCDPINELKNIENKNIIHMDEYKMFTPSKNFDCLLSSVIKKGIDEFKN
ncbi:negative elongation factor A, putative [Plasmodium ovale]|uniref:Negative elongation factor A, putative n=2 Tax=Plasmodium ovale TaxID=36330 RepID=A0A1D3U9W1_PLAOA|nr:negative elongation factor A, putative [Plasmodium ovale]